MLARFREARDALPVTTAAERWLALVGAVEQLATAQTLDDVIAVVRKTARAISGADGVTFVLKDQDRCHYIEEDAVGPLWKGSRFPLAACISGWCMLNDQAAVIPDIYADPRIPHDAYRPTFVKSLVMMPVKAGEPVAAIGSYWAEEQDFDNGEIALLQGLVRSASAAIVAVQMRETLRESEARLSMALKAGDLGTWELDLASETFDGSATARANFGFAPDAQMSRRTMGRAIHPDDLEALRHAFALAIRDGADIRSVARNLRADGTIRWVAIRGRAVYDASGHATRVIGVVGDVTERYKARERLDQLQSDIAHIGRLSEMGQMVSAFAHELRQPLTAANNYLGAAKRFLAREDMPVAHALEMIEKANGQFERAAQIIQRIRGFSTKTEATTASEDVGRLINEAGELAQLDPRHRGVSLRIEVVPGLPPALVDKVQIQQVLLNLLRNAFEATEGRNPRRVTVRAKRAKADDLIEISVTDTGPGLAAGVVAKLFQPFVTTKDSGMGVGLSICRTIVDSHGGRMWAQCKPGKGATFFFTVPAAH